PHHTEHPGNPPPFSVRTRLADKRQPYRYCPLHIRHTAQIHHSRQASAHRSAFQHRLFLADTPAEQRTVHSARPFHRPDYLHSHRNPPCRRNHPKSIRIACPIPHN